MTFDETPAFLSMADAARRAGQSDLLRDIGTRRSASTDGKARQAADDALTLFRKNHKFSSNGTRDCSTRWKARRCARPRRRAMRSATIRQRRSGRRSRFRTAGKWFVARLVEDRRGRLRQADFRAACRRQDLSSGRKAERQRAIATGPAKFCITNVEFEIQGARTAPGTRPDRSGLRRNAHQGAQRIHRACRRHGPDRAARDLRRARRNSPGASASRLRVSG